MDTIWFEDVDQSVLDEERRLDPEVWDLTEETE